VLLVGLSRREIRFRFLPGRDQGVPRFENDIGGTYSVNYVVYLIRTKNKMQNHFSYDLFYKKAQKIGR